jgi:hypothetical protein
MLHKSVLEYSYNTSYIDSSIDEETNEIGQYIQVVYCGFRTKHDLSGIRIWVTYVQK